VTGDDNPIHVSTAAKEPGEEALGCILQSAQPVVMVQASRIRTMLGRVWWPSLEGPGPRESRGLKHCTHARTLDAHGWIAGLVCEMGQMGTPPPGGNRQAGRGGGVWHRTLLAPPSPMRQQGSRHDGRHLSLGPFPAIPPSTMSILPSPFFVGRYVRSVRISYLRLVYTQ